MRDDGDSTERIEVSDTDPTSEIDPPPATPPPLVPHAAVPFVRRVIERGWLEIVQAGALGFLVVLVAGSVLVLAAKLNFPSLGASADLLGALNGIVIAGLGILNVPIIFDGVAIAVLPLGALVVTGWGIVWAVRTTIRPPEGDAGTIIRSGARVAIPFAVLCWFAALVFRVRGVHPVAADGGATLIVAAFWGAIFGALGALQTRRSLREWAKAVWNALRARAPIYDEGVFSGAATLVLVMVSAAGATLLWIIISLARDAPGRYFTVGDAVAYIVYLAALLPNAVISVAAVAFGSSIDVGARLTLGGNVVGPVREYSLWAWGRGEPPEVVYLLALIPVFACMGGGFLARRRTSDAARMAPVLVTSSAVFATALTLLAWLAKMRLAGVGRGTGYASVAPDVVVTFFAAFLLAGVLGAAGWKLAESERLARGSGGRSGA